MAHKSLRVYDFNINKNQSTNVLDMFKIVEMNAIINLIKKIKKLSK
jgi:hypothetical protein